MSLRSRLFDVIKADKIKNASPNLLTDVWSGLTLGQKTKLVKGLLTEPHIFGEKLRDELFKNIESEVNAELDTLLAQATIDRTFLEGLFS